jgi:hypothetical protein
MSHKQISFIKSGVRIVGYIALIIGFSDHWIFGIASTLLILAEVLGILEEVNE